MIMTVIVSFYSPSCFGQETAKGFTLSFFIAVRQAEKKWIPIFTIFRLTRPEIEPEFTVSVADALSTQTLIGKIGNQILNDILESSVESGLLPWWDYVIEISEICLFSAVDTVYWDEKIFWNRSLSKHLIQLNSTSTHCMIDFIYMII